MEQRGLKHRCNRVYNDSNESSVYCMYKSPSCLGVCSFCEELSQILCSHEIEEEQVQWVPIHENKSLARESPGAHGNIVLSVEEHSPLSERVAFALNDTMACVWVGPFQSAASSSSPRNRSQKGSVRSTLASGSSRSGSDASRCRDTQLKCENATSVSFSRRVHSSLKNLLSTNTEPASRRVCSALTFNTYNFCILPHRSSTRESHTAMSIDL